jgi:starch phosphorylase
MKNLTNASGNKTNPVNKPFEKLSPSTNPLKGMDVESLELSFVDHLEFSLATDRYSALPHHYFWALALTARDRLIERWIETQQSYYKKDAKRVYYLSMEFLMGRMLGNALINLNLQGNMKKALYELGFSLEELCQLENDPGLGNGGLGRLAACFLDSLATLEMPANGYGIRYEFGIFAQKIENGYQVEAPDHWLRFGSPWGIERPEYCFPIKFYGRVQEYKDENGDTRFDWVDTDDVVAEAFDVPVPGFRNNTVNNLRLWSAKSSDEFNLSYFNHGDYNRAVADQIESEIISKILYPRDDFFEGKELRLKQEYFLVSATLQDIIRRYKKTHDDQFQAFPEKVAIQLNDTHPALAIPELMRLLMDKEKIQWEKAWNICVNTFAYTNHTVLTEALEQWSLDLAKLLLPRHVQIINEINQRFLAKITTRFPKDVEKVRRMSLMEEGGEKRVRMANLAIVGSHSVNGVAALHTEIIKKRLFKDFYDLWPEKFNNKTNGITQRRWLLLCNPGLAQLISSKIGECWMTDLFELKKLVQLSEDQDLQKQWQQIKQNNKSCLAEYIRNACGVEVNAHSMFDCQVKRLHEYKRQLLNILHVITLYNRLKNGIIADSVPRTVIFAGKAAPAYAMAKLIIKLINSVADVVNNDGDIGELLKVVFIPDYSVSLAELIIPATDLSEQISTAGLEASGTGNMKFALNGALTIGTLDGANIEIMEEVGKENIFIFGLTAEEVNGLQNNGYAPLEYLKSNQELKQVLDMIFADFFSKSEPGIFKPIIDVLLKQGDQYMLLADYSSYIKCQEEVGRTYQEQAVWTKKSILNAANMGKFSSDRTIRQYAEEIWNAKPVPITLNQNRKSKSGN